MKQINKVIGYIRVSTVDQDTKKNEEAILRYANTHDFGKVEFVSEKVSGMKSWKTRKLYDVVQQLDKGDILIVPELSRLGRSLKDVLDVLNELTKKGVKIYSVKEDFQLNSDDMQSKVMRTMLGLFGEIERDLISARTKEGQAAARLKGHFPGRPKGIGKSRQDEHREDIIKLLNNGSKLNFIASKHNVTPATVTHWVKRHKIIRLTIPVPNTPSVGRRRLRLAAKEFNSKLNSKLGIEPPMDTNAPNEELIKQLREVWEQYKDTVLDDITEETRATLKDFRIIKS